MSTDMQEEQEKKEQQYQEHQKKKQQQEELIDWRRGQVIELISKGKNLTQIAEILKVDVSTVSRDHQYIRENANSILKNFFVKILPLEATKCLSRLTSISNEAWKMAEQTDKEGDRKTQATALSLAQKAALDILEVLTDNQLYNNDISKSIEVIEILPQQGRHCTLYSSLQQVVSDRDKEERHLLLHYFIRT